MTFLFFYLIKLGIGFLIVKEINSKSLFNSSNIKENILDIFCIFGVVELLSWIF